MTPGLDREAFGLSDGQIFGGYLRFGGRFPPNLLGKLLWHFALLAPRNSGNSQVYRKWPAMQGGKLEERWLLPPKAVKNVPEWKLEFKKVVNVWEMMSESRGDGSWATAKHRPQAVGLPDFCLLRLMQHWLNSDSMGFLIDSDHPRTWIIRC